MRENLLKIIKYYGVLPQLKYFQSEVYELTEAILEERYWEGTKEHITEEIADVKVMLDQFIEYYELDRDEIYEIWCNKIDRQLDRIAEENKK